MVFSYLVSKNGDVNVFSLTGELVDKNQSAQMVADIEKLIAGGSNKFVFDMSQLKYLNSSGLSVLITTLTKARNAGGEVVIANVSKKVRELLVITKLNTVFLVTDSVEQAITKIS